MGGATNTFEVGAYQAPVFGSKSVLQGELDDYFTQQPKFNSSENLGISLQDTFNLGGDK